MEYTHLEKQNLQITRNRYPSGKKNRIDRMNAVKETTFDRLVREHVDISRKLINENVNLLKKIMQNADYENLPNPDRLNCRSISLMLVGIREICRIKMLRQSFRNQNAREHIHHTSYSNDPQFATNTFQNTAKKNWRSATRNDFSILGYIHHLLQPETHAMTQSKSSTQDRIDAVLYTEVIMKRIPRLVQFFLNQKPERINEWFEQMMKLILSFQMMSPENQKWILQREFLLWSEMIQVRKIFKDPLATLEPLPMTVSVLKQSIGMKEKEILHTVNNFYNWYWKPENTPFPKSLEEIAKWLIHELKHFEELNDLPKQFTNPINKETVQNRYGEQVLQILALQEQMMNHIEFLCLKKGMDIENVLVVNPKPFSQEQVQHMTSEDILKSQVHLSTIIPSCVCTHVSKFIFEQ